MSELFPKTEKTGIKENKLSNSTLSSQFLHIFLSPYQIAEHLFSGNACRRDLFTFLLADMADPFISLKNEVESTLREISSAHDWTSRFVTNAQEYLVQDALYTLS
jgi:hypothetical protein